MKNDAQNRPSGPAETITTFEIQFAGVSAPSRKLFDYADALRQVGRCHDALKVYEALEDSTVPDEHRWRVALFKGETLHEMGRYSDAERAFREACELEGSTVPRVYLAGSLAAQERFAEAVNVLTEAEKYPGDQDEVLLNLALNQRTLGLLVEAQSSLERAKLFTPEYEEVDVVLRDILAALAVQRNSHEKNRRASG